MWTVVFWWTSISAGLTAHIAHSLLDKRRVHFGTRERIESLAHIAHSGSTTTNWGLEPLFIGDTNFLEARESRAPTSFRSAERPPQRSSIHRYTPDSERVERRWL